MLSGEQVNDTSCWDSYKEKRTNVDLYVDNAVVMYVPTYVGVRGNAQIRRFFLNPQFAEKNVSVQETVNNQVFANNQLVEESVWTVHFHTGECSWLVPQVEDRLLRNATVKFPMTTFVHFDSVSNKIASIRYFWDQAGVLKQLKIIPDKLGWPVTSGEKQAESLLSLNKVQLKGLNGDDNHGDNQNDQNKSSTGRNIFTYQPPPERRLVAPTNKLNSSFTFSHDEGSKPTASQSMPAAGKPTPRILHNIIG